MGLPRKGGVSPPCTGPYSSFFFPWSLEAPFREKGGGCCGFPNAKSEETVHSSEERREISKKWPSGSATRSFLVLWPLGTTPRNSRFPKFRSWCDLLQLIENCMRIQSILCSSEGARILKCMLPCAWALFFRWPLYERRVRALITKGG